MKEKYLIEDLLSQSHHGAIFRASDRETGLPVVLRRYFPFGRGCGGLDAEAQKIYEGSIADLRSLRHESLAPVIDGGCDEVDGIPFIATEWIHGETIEELQSRVMLGIDDVYDLLNAAIDLSLWISQILGRETLWVDTDLATVLRRDSGNPRNYVFCVSPYKWLGTRKSDGDLMELSGFASQLLQGMPHANGDVKYNHLVHWIEWLRVAPPSTTLDQVRSKLAQPANPSAQAPVRRTAAPQPKTKSTLPRKRKRPFRAMLWVNLFLAFGTAVFGAYAHQAKQSRAEARAPRTDLKVDKTSAKKQIAKKKNTQRSSGAMAISSNATASEVMSWDDSKLLEHVRCRVTVQGPAARVDQSKSGKTLYLVFLGGDDPDSSRVGIRVGKQSPDEIKSKLAAFVGKTIRASGEVKKEMQGNLSSAAVMINDVSAIQTID
ncbi:MAG: hypothetical protein ACO3F7_07160 [Luteolibacter sp.]